MPIGCAVSLDNLRTVAQALLTEAITQLGTAQVHAICRALTHATGCS